MTHSRADGHYQLRRERKARISTLRSVQQIWRPYSGSATPLRLVKFIPRVLHSHNANLALWEWRRKKKCSHLHSENRFAHLGSGFEICSLDYLKPDHIILKGHFDPKDFPCKNKPLLLVPLPANSHNNLVRLSRPKRL